MSARANMSIDYGGAEGGKLAMAFAAGCVATFAFCMAIGKFIWSKIGTAKDDEIARLKETMEANEARCAAMETRLVQRIQQLEGFILAMSPGHLRQDFQRALSEQRVVEDSIHKEAGE